MKPKPHKLRFRSKFATAPVFRGRFSLVSWKSYPRPLAATLSFVHPRRTRGSDAGPGGEHRMEKALACGGRQLAAGPAIAAPPESRPLKQAGGVTGGPWLPCYKKVESKAARYP